MACARGSGRPSATVAIRVWHCPWNGRRGLQRTPHSRLRERAERGSDLLLLKRHQDIGGADADHTRRGRRPTAAAMKRSDVRVCRVRYRARLIVKLKSGQVVELAATDN